MGPYAKLEFWCPLSLSIILINDLLTYCKLFFSNIWSTTCSTQTLTAAVLFACVRDTRCGPKETGHTVRQANPNPKSNPRSKPNPIIYRYKKVQTYWTDYREPMVKGSVSKPMIRRKAGELLHAELHSATFHLTFLTRGYFFYHAVFLLFLLFPLCDTDLSL